MYYLIMISMIILHNTLVVDTSKELETNARPVLVSMRVVFPRFLYLFQVGVRTAIC